MTEERIVSEVTFLDRDDMNTYRVLIMDEQVAATLPYSRFEQIETKNVPMGSVALVTDMIADDYEKYEHTPFFLKYIGEDGHTWNCMTDHVKRILLDSVLRVTGLSDGNDGIYSDMWYDPKATRRFLNLITPYISKEALSSWSWFEDDLISVSNLRKFVTLLTKPVARGMIADGYWGPVLMVDILYQWNRHTFFYEIPFPGDDEIRRIEMLRELRQQSMLSFDTATFTVRLRSLFLKWINEKRFETPQFDYHGI